MTILFRKHPQRAIPDTFDTSTGSIVNVAHFFGDPDGPYKFRQSQATGSAIFVTPQIANFGRFWQFGGYQKWHFQWPAINETCWDHPGHQKNEPH